MNAKKVKRLCSVKGCHSTDTYAISNINEYGGVIICKTCLEGAIKAIDSPAESVATAKKVNVPLFYHPTENAETVEITVDEWVCEVCGKVCKSELGLKSHVKSHEVKTDEQ